jgi:hypothetical protein
MRRQSRKRLTVGAAVAPATSRAAHCAEPGAHGLPSGDSAYHCRLRKDATSKTKSTAVATPAPTDQEIADAKAKGLVWVNTSTKVYHKDGQYYGKTKKGKFMPKPTPKKAGYGAAWTSTSRNIGETTAPNEQLSVVVFLGAPVVPKEMIEQTDTSRRDLEVLLNRRLLAARRRYLKESKQYRRLIEEGLKHDRLGSAEAPGIQEAGRRTTEALLSYVHAIRVLTDLFMPSAY